MIKQESNLGVQMKKFIQIFSVVTGLVILLLGLCYIGLAVYYQDGFSYGTYINGVYCTGKSVSQVNEELDREFKENTAFTIVINGTTKQIELDDISYSFDFAKPLNVYLEQQNSYLWIEHLFESKEGITLTPDGVYDYAAFEKAYSSLHLFDSNLPETVSCILTEDGYVIRDGKQNVYDEEKVIQLLTDSLLEGILIVDLDSMDCQKNLSYTEEEQQLLSLFEKIDSFQNRNISIRFGDEIRTISKRELADVLKCNESNYPYLNSEQMLEIDEEVVNELANQIASEYNTYGNHHFINHAGIEVYLSKGNYGNEIDEKKESQWLFATLSGTEQTVEHEPEFIHTANYLGKDDIGDTYIEISISEQKMFYFENGEIVLETDVVTGNTGRNHGTPQKVCYVYGKQEKRVLRGPGYASFVNYWVPVSGNIGIHDAPWRDEYGGEIYKTNGSHGCINTPYDMMQQLYEMVEIGTPVIIYDLDNPDTF